MGWRADGGLWLLVRGGGLFLSKGSGVCKLILPFLVHYDGIQVLRSVFTSFLSLHFLGEFGVEEFRHVEKIFVNFQEERGKIYQKHDFNSCNKIEGCELS